MNTTGFLFSPGRAVALVALLAAAPAAHAADMLKVIDVRKGHHLNVRTGPSLSAGVITGVSNGAELESLGCREAEGGRWCNIITPKGVTGWSFGKFLSGGAVAAAPAAAAPAAAPAMFAMGKLKCEKSDGTPLGDCDYGVMRAGGGKATLQVIWASGLKRMMAIDNGAVTSANAAVTAKPMDGGLDITVNASGSPSEHYQVPADVLVAK